MVNIKFQIDGKDENLSKVWVHLQSASINKGNFYTMKIPNVFLGSVFDPYNTKSEKTAWPLFIQAQINELGTFIVEGYVESITKINGKCKMPFSWVLATIDEIKKTSEGIEITGKVVPFGKHK